MKPARCTHPFWLPCLLAVGIGVAAANPADTNLSPALSPRDLAIMTPPVVLHRSPVEVFRELLAMNSAERNQALSSRPAESRERLLAKIREYRALEANERELRLQATELRWYLLPLLRTPATNRTDMLARVPETYRPVIEGRLTQWDRLAAETQERLLSNEQAVRYLTQLGVTTAPSPTSVRLESLPPTERQATQLGLDRLDALSEKDRQEAMALFQNFFEFSPAEKERALRQMSAVERAQMEQTIRDFLALPPEQRSQCVRSFAQFAKLTPGERREFLKNAERWEAMTPAERQAWRELVKNVQILPPLPAGLDGNTPPMPESPPRPRNPQRSIPKP